MSCRDGLRNQFPVRPGGAAVEAESNDIVIVSALQNQKHVNLVEEAARTLEGYWLFYHQRSSRIDFHLQGLRGPVGLWRGLAVRCIALDS